MTPRAFSLLRLLLAGIAILASANAFALNLRCGSRIVKESMIAAQVRNACGAPFWTDTFVSLEILGAGGPIEQQHEVNWDVWYFNFGSSMFMQRLTFRDGQLQKIEPLGYGVNEIGTSCIAAVTSRGLTSGELIAHCGEPASRQFSGGSVVHRARGVLFANEDRREEWLYDDGSAYLTRYLITNSNVTSAERLPR